MKQHLQKLREAMELRGFSEDSKRYYGHHVAAFLEEWDKPPEDATENDIRDYLYFLLKFKKYHPSTINQYNTALRFFYEVILNRILNLKAIPRFEPETKLPVLLSREEIWRLFDVCELRDKAIFMTFYGSGIRLYAHICPIR